MDASAVSLTETSRDNPAAGKRPKLEPPADDDEDISIIEENINVRPPQATGATSSIAGPSQVYDGELAEENQDSKIAEFRNKMIKYEEEASRLRTQLKREQEKSQNVGRDAEVVKRYLEQKCEEERKRVQEAEGVAQQKAAAAEKKATGLQKQCDRLETKVQSKEAEIECRDKMLANAAKDLNEAKKKCENVEKEAAEAKKKATDAEQREAGANAKTAEAEVKKAAAKKEVSDLRHKLEELKKSKATADRKLKAKITEIENQMANTEASEQPSSSTAEQLGKGLSEGNKRIARKDEEITKLRTDNDRLKKKLAASEAKATRLENAREKAVTKKDGEILSLKEEIVDLEDKIEELEKLAYPAIILNAHLETGRLQQEFGRFDGIADKLTMKCDHGGVYLQSIPSRPTLPKALLELKSSFFDDYECHEECLAQTDYSLLLKGFASQAGKEQCQLICLYDHCVGIQFKHVGEEDYDPALHLVTNDKVVWSLIEDNAPYACTFEMNSFVLAQAAQKLSPVLLDFSNLGQMDEVVITDSEDRMGGDRREHLWHSLPGDNHANDFKAEFNSTAPDTHLRIFVDPKYLRRCVMASSDAGSKIVEVAMSEDTLRLRYGNDHFSLSYYIPTVKPTQNGERDELEWVPIEDNAPYVCTFEMNSFVLAQAAQKLGLVLLDFSKHGQPDAVTSTDSEVGLSGAERECLWRSLPGINPHENDFKAEFGSATPDTHLSIYVCSEYLRRCVMASSGAGKCASKTVEVAMSEDTLRLLYGNEHFTLTYYVPTVKPTEFSERSPIEFEHEVLFS
ncbi:hypothetical protein AAVH_09040 [Aphelenchoides avenae]|nr:hypothetical protein AAVH_09040 [Aphelenchus avenae]